MLLKRVAKIIAVEEEKAYKTIVLELETLNENKHYETIRAIIELVK